MTLTTEESDVSLDSILTVLADERRRLIIRYFETASNGVTTREELAEYVSTTSPDEQDREKTKTRLHHVSLPKLDSAGLIEYDSRSTTVRYDPQPEVDALLKCIDTIDKT